MSASAKLTIKQKLQKLPDRAAPQQGFADELKRKSLAAILQGNRDGNGVSQQWKDYMTMIVGTDAPNQLQRLMLEDNQAGNSWIRDSAAYIVSNGSCGPDTLKTTGQFVDDRIDIDIENGEPLKEV